MIGLQTYLDKQQAMVCVRHPWVSRRVRDCQRMTGATIQAQKICQKMDGHLNVSEAVTSSLVKNIPLPSSSLLRLALHGGAGDFSAVDAEGIVELP